MAEDNVLELPQGSNPFPFESAFVDACSRIGLPPGRCAELESFWWFMMDDSWPSPEDFASAIMVHLPNETAEEADKRRSLIRMDLYAVEVHEKIVKKKPNKRRTRIV